MSYNDFTPDYSFNDVEKSRPFRVWCQKVLPTIYDDSLSYYELLNKVVYILNECIDKINELDENVDELNKAYQQLVTYLNEYKNYVETRFDKQDENIARLEKELDKAIEDLNNRMDNVIEEAGDKIQEIIDNLDVEQIINEKFEQFIDSPEYKEMLENKIIQVIGESADLTEMENNVKSIKSTIGASDDEAGGLTTGTVMGKLNYLIKYGSGGGGGGGSSTATEALLNDVVNNIGKSSDEGATSATGTIFGKLNMLVKNLVESNFISDFTTRLSNIKSVVDSNNTGINVLQGRCANINTTVSEVHTMVRDHVIPNEQTLLQDVGSIDDKIGTSGDTTSTTLFGKMNTISSGSGSGFVNLGRNNRVLSSLTTSNDGSAENVEKYGYNMPYVQEEHTGTIYGVTPKLFYVTFKKSGYLCFDVYCEGTSEGFGIEEKQPPLALYDIDDDYIKCESNKEFSTDTNVTDTIIMQLGYDYTPETNTMGTIVRRLTSPSSNINETYPTVLGGIFNVCPLSTRLKLTNTYAQNFSEGELTRNYVHVDAGFTVSVALVAPSAQLINTTKLYMGYLFITD